MNTERMYAITVYACETGLLTEEQRATFDYEPLTEILIPESIAIAFYEDINAAEEVAEELQIPVEQATFRKWYNEVYTADSTVGLWAYCVSRGYTPTEA